VRDCWVPRPGYVFGFCDYDTLEMRTLAQVYLWMMDVDTCPLLEAINAALQMRGRPGMTLEEAAFGFIRVANEQMARAIREVTVARGFDVRRHVLACFGGAGGQHACALARSLGIPRVRIHRFAGILSAYGLGLADVVRERQQPAAAPLHLETVSHFKQRLEDLAALARRDLEAAGFSPDRIRVLRFLHLRYEGTDHGWMVPEPEDLNFEQAFRATYRREYGFELEGRRIWVDDLRVRAVLEHVGHRPVGVGDLVVRHDAAGIEFQRLPIRLHCPFEIAVPEKLVPGPRIGDVV